MGPFHQVWNIFQQLKSDSFHNRIRDGPILAAEFLENTMFKAKSKMLEK